MHLWAPFYILLLTRLPKNRSCKKKAEAIQRFNSSGGTTSQDLSTSFRGSQLIIYLLESRELKSRIDCYIKKTSELNNKIKRKDTSTRLLCGYKRHFSWKQIEAETRRRGRTHGAVQADRCWLIRYTQINSKYKKRHSSLRKLKDKSGDIYLYAFLRDFLFL